MHSAPNALQQRNCDFGCCIPDTPPSLSVANLVHAGYSAAGQRGLPSCPELIIVSQDEVMLMSVSCDIDFLKATCKLPLDAPPVACCPLGMGLFFVIDAAANAAVLSIAAAAAPAAGAPAPGRSAPRLAALRCFRAAVGPEAPIAAPGSMAEALATWGAPEDGRGPMHRHVSAAAVLPCAHVPEMQHFAALVVVGTLAGPSCVVGVPQDRLKAALEAADDCVCLMCAAAHAMPVYIFLSHCCRIPQAGNSAHAYTMLRLCSCPVALKILIAECFFSCCWFCA